MRLCSRKECCSKEMFDKAISWGCTSVEAGELVEFLVEQKFVDERRYTEAFVNDKLRLNKWGRGKIAYMLRMLNIDNEIIADVFSEVDDVEYQRILSGELQKKYRSIRQGTSCELSAKLFRFAASRGFEAELINDELLKMIKK